MCERLILANTNLSSPVARDKMGLIGKSDRCVRTRDLAELRACLLRPDAVKLVMLSTDDSELLTMIRELRDLPVVVFYGDEVGAVGAAGMVGRYRDGKRLTILAPASKTECVGEIVRSFDGRMMRKDEKAGILAWEWNGYEASLVEMVLPLQTQGRQANM